MPITKLKKNEVTNIIPASTPIIGSIYVRKSEVIVTTELTTSLGAIY
jgi:hypothetical protein